MSTAKKIGPTQQWRLKEKATQVQEAARARKTRKAMLASLVGAVIVSVACRGDDESVDMRLSDGRVLSVGASEWLSLYIDGRAV